MDIKIAKYLLEINAVTLETKSPYTWASGIKAPIYCDNRLTLSYPQIRREIENGLASLIKKNYSEAEIIIGTATAGIAHAALVADVLDLPMGYVRTSSKGHGKKNQIEGVIKAKQKAVVVEDLISTGMSSLDVVKTLREKNVNVLGIVSIFAYNLPVTVVNFKRFNLNYYSLSNYGVLTEVALKNNYISTSDFEKLKKWHENPNSCTWMN